MRDERELLRKFGVQLAGIVSKRKRTISVCPVESTAHVLSPQQVYPLVRVAVSSTGTRMKNDVLSNR